VPSPLRIIADQAFSRAAGAPLVEGNTVQLLCDARENYPAWLEAIHAAEKWIHFESYILRDDRSGREFADALVAATRRGVRVRLLYDWLGAQTATPWMFWARLRKAGIDVRAFNPPRLDSPLGWLSRDHRKMIGVDGRVGFVTGLCVADMWWGRERNNNLDPWRDTGVAVRGPAVADIESAFAEVWAAAGPPLPEDERVSAPIAQTGQTSLRVIGTKPSVAGLFRLDQLVAALARERLWITDAYFVGASPYVQALIAASHDGVDVRMLVPGSGSDLPVVQRLTQSGYRQLLAAGIRIFEWNGTMVHAKTAVADSKWARVGSSNLNIQSWLGNWELDVAIEDERFARQMEEVFLQDLQNATEVVLSDERVHRVSEPPRRTTEPATPFGRRGRTARTRRAATAGALRMGRTFGAALTARRAVGAAEAVSLMWGIALVAGLGVVGLNWPRALAYPLGVLFLWVAVSWMIQAVRLWPLRLQRRAPAEAPKPSAGEDAA
jgi:cardiolipin synthase